MVKRLKQNHMEEMEDHRKPRKKYHQSGRDRMHEAEGMEKRRRTKKYHQTKKDRMNEAAGMRKNHYR